MYRYLTEHGIAAERLIKEERSTNTKENLDFSLRSDRQYGAYSIGVVTNNFHVFRGVAIGKKCGCQKNLSDSVEILFLETAHLYSKGNPCNSER